MENNDILRRLRYTFDISDSAMIEIFGLANKTVTRPQISDWLKKDDDPAFKAMYDQDLAFFLNGFINLKRGKKEGEQPKPERSLSNNIIFRKLRIALNYRDDDIIEVFKLVRLHIGKSELSAFFRHPSQKHFRPCKDQFLRNFLLGLQRRYKDGEKVEKAKE